MEIYTGIDIIEVDRIKENIEKHEKNFLNKVYTEKEIEYCESKGVSKYQSYAARFAGKEAVFKAISKLLNNKFEIGWKDIEILNDEYGRPVVNLNWKNNKNIKTEISISHTSKTAIASVVVVAN